MAVRVEESIKSRDEPLGSRLTEQNSEDRDGCQSQVTPRILRGISLQELCAPIGDRIAIWRGRGGRIEIRHLCLAIAEEIGSHRADL
jgi:hypothetical protein